MKASILAVLLVTLLMAACGYRAAKYGAACDDELPGFSEVACQQVIAEFRQKERERRQQQELAKRYQLQEECKILRWRASQAQLYTGQYTQNQTLDGCKINQSGYIDCNQPEPKIPVCVDLYSSKGPTFWTWSDYNECARRQEVLMQCIRYGL